MYNGSTHKTIGQGKNNIDFLFMEILICFTE